MQDVVISIKGRQTVEDWDCGDAIELITPGKLETHAGGYVISYRESELTGMDGIETTLKVEPRRVTITRTGGVFSEMVFEQGQRHLSFYDCVTCVAHGAEFYGAYSLDGGVMVGVNARRVKTSFDEHGGMIDLEYALEIENRVSGHNKMEIEFRRVH